MPQDDTCAICQRTKLNGVGRFFNLPERGTGRRRRWDAVFADLGIVIRDVSIRRNFGVCWRHFLEGRPSREPANPDFVPCIRLWGDDDSGFLNLGRMPSIVSNSVSTGGSGSDMPPEPEIPSDDDSGLEPSTKRRGDFLFGHQLLPQRAFMETPFTEIVDVPVASECVEVVTSLELPKAKKPQTVDFSRRRVPDEDQLVDQLYAESDLIYSNDPVLTASAEPHQLNSQQHSLTPTYTLSCADPQQPIQQNLRIKWVRMNSGIPIRLTANAHSSSPSSSAHFLPINRTTVAEKRLRGPPRVDKRIVDQMSTNDHAFREAARVIQEVADVRKRDASFAEAYRVIQDIESNRYSDNRKFKQKQRSETRGCVAAPCRNCRMTYYWPPQTMRQRLVWVHQTSDGREQRFDGRVDGSQPYFRCPICDIESPTNLDPATEHLFC